MKHLIILIVISITIFAIAYGQMGPGGESECEDSVNNLTLPFQIVDNATSKYNNDHGTKYEAIDINKIQSKIENKAIMRLLFSVSTNCSFILNNSQDTTCVLETFVTIYDPFSGAEKITVLKLEEKKTSHKIKTLEEAGEENQKEQADKR